MLLLDASGVKLKYNFPFFCTNLYFLIILNNFSLDFKITKSLLSNYIILIFIAFLQGTRALILKNKCMH